MKNTTTRLHFTKEELKNKIIFHEARNVDKTADKVKSRISKKCGVRYRTEESAGYKRKLRSESEEIPKPVESQKANAQRSLSVSADKSGGGQNVRRQTYSNFEKAGTSKVKSHIRNDENAMELHSPGHKFRHAAVYSFTETAASGIHRGIAEHEEDNAGVQAAHHSEQFAENTAKTVHEAVYSHKLKAYQKAVRLERKADRANTKALFRQAASENTESVSNPFSRWRQRQQIKKQYYKAKKAAGFYSAGGQESRKTIKSAGTVLNRLKDAVLQHSHIWVIVLISAAFLMLISGAFSSCSAMMQGSMGTVMGSSFTASDDAIIGVNKDYRDLEISLQNQIDNIESTHTGYDEYRYQLDEINHNPYELTAYLTVVYEDYSREEVQGALRDLFDAQYELELEEETEVRTRTETRTHTVTDPVTGETHQEEYEVEVEYEYKILHVTLQNHGLGTAIDASGLSEDEKERYEVLLKTQGNRPYLFEDDIYANSTGPYLDYDIPGEALTDEKFANMIQEAEKYLGMSYVWGGSSPDTGFDCSGFVSCVLNHCGNSWDVGRMTANGLMGCCDIIPASEAKPGDLIFFKGTYDTAGASHVGIYVGNGMMIHCGNPISYASVETSYWRSHFYCYGRIQ